MSLVKRIIEAVTQTPGMNCAEIAAATNANPGAVKVALWKLSKSERLKREKQPAKGRQKGPQTEFVYSV